MPVDPSTLLLLFFFLQLSLPSPFLSFKIHFFLSHLSLPLNSLSLQPFFFCLTSFPPFFSRLFFCSPLPRSGPSGNQRTWITFIPPWEQRNSHGRHGNTAILAPQELFHWEGSGTVLCFWTLSLARQKEKNTPIKYRCELKQNLLWRVRLLRGKDWGYSEAKRRHSHTNPTDLWIHGLIETSLRYSAFCLGLITSSLQHSYEFCFFFFLNLSPNKAVYWRTKKISVSFLNVRICRLSLSPMTVKEESPGFGLLDGQKKHQDVMLAVKTVMQTTDTHELCICTRRGHITVTLHGYTQSFASESGWGRKEVALLQPTELQNGEIAGWESVGTFQTISRLFPRHFKSKP